MAEVAGLVIGGVALIGLFDSCMNLLRTIETGRNFEDDYHTAALKVVMLSHRLARWERTYRASTFHGTAKDGQVAKWALEEIYKQLQAAKDADEPYLPRDSRSAGTDDMAVVRATDNIKALALRRKPVQKASLATKGSWALRGKDKMDGVISTLEFFIRNLESLSSTTSTTTRQAAIQNEASELVESSAIEEPDTAIPILQAAAAAADPELAREIQSGRHTFHNFKISDSAVAIKGNWVAQGATVTGYGSDYSDIMVSGNAKSFSGDMYGGENPTAGWFR